MKRKKEEKKEAVHYSMNEYARQKVMFIFSSITYITMKNIRLHQGLIIMMYCSSYSYLISVTIYVYSIFIIIIPFTYVRYSDNVLLFFFLMFILRQYIMTRRDYYLYFVFFYVVNHCLHLIVYYRC